MGRRPKHVRKEFDSLKNAFLAVYPWSDNRIDEWIELDEQAAIAIMCDGRSFLYDDRARRIRAILVIRDTDDIMELTDEEWLKGFGERLDNMIHESGYRKQELAEQVGISNAMLSKYINGIAIPRVNIVHKMSCLLGCSVDDLMPKDYIFVNR